MGSVDIEFSKALLAEAHKTVKQHFPETNLRADAWTVNVGRDHWEFHGPEKFYWHGSADNAFEARYHGWLAWLSSKGIDA